MPKTDDKHLNSIADDVVANTPYGDPSHVHFEVRKWGEMIEAAGYIIVKADDYDATVARARDANG